MQKTTITGGDLPGLKALAERIRGADRNVLVGVPADAKTEDDGTSMALVAATNEFGSEDGKIPERAFMRTGIARGRHKFERLSRISLTKIVQGTETVEHGLGLLGEMAKGEMQRAIKDSKQLFKRTVRQGDVPSDADTCNWKQKKLRIGDPIPYCEACGAKFAYNHPAMGFFVYVSGKWRMGRHGIPE